MTRTLADRLATLDVDVGRLTAVSGGDSGAALWRVDGGEPLIVKRDSPARIRGEADGLRALADADSGLIVPRVIAVDEDLLIMQALATDGPRDGARLGEGLRRLHLGTRRSGEAHGWPIDNACGATPQPNAPLADGRAFQRERRLLPLMQVCRERELLDASTSERIERVADGLDAWLADVAPCLVHGDLWSGNVLFTPEGPAIIDPAVYRHYPDVDLAMLTLFGDPGEAFFEAYWNGAAPEDWCRREALFQLYPLLNHLYLFGGSYRRGVTRALDRILAQ